MISWPKNQMKFYRVLVIGLFLSSFFSVSAQQNCKRIRTLSNRYNFKLQSPDFTLKQSNRITGIGRNRILRIELLMSHEGEFRLNFKSEKFSPIYRRYSLLKGQEVELLLENGTNLKRRFLNLEEMKGGIMKNYITLTLEEMQLLSNTSIQEIVLLKPFQNSEEGEVREFKIAEYQRKKLMGYSHCMIQKSKQ